MSPGAQEGRLPFSLSLSSVPSPCLAALALPLGQCPRSLPPPSLPRVGEEGTPWAKPPRLLDWSFPQHPTPNTSFWSLFRDCEAWSALSYSLNWNGNVCQGPIEREDWSQPSLPSTQN